MFQSDMLPQLNFPDYPFTLREKDKQMEIFDSIRKKFVLLTAEEWVRQHVLRFLTEETKIPKPLINVEKQITVNRLHKRVDIIVFDRKGCPLLLVECKSPQKEITQTVFDQAARYNMGLHVSFFALSNGLMHYYCKIDYENQRYSFLETLPSFEEMILLNKV